MTTNPNIPQGTLNLARASVSLPDNPELNITAPYMTEGMVSLSFDTEAASLLPTATGAAKSLATYQMATITVHGIKSQSLYNSWERRRKSNSDIGDLVVRGDSPTLDSYTFNSCIISNIRELTFNGKDPEYVLVLRGTYPVNSSLWA